jgi:hypothetical protein
MYRIDLEGKRLIKIPATSFSLLSLKERFDIQEWIEKTPEILGEQLLIIAKELILPSGRRLDLLAIDKNASLVVIELKRDDSGTDVEWQAIKYASYCSAFSQDDVYRTFAEFLGMDSNEAQTRIEKFIDCELDQLNSEQRIILVAREFHADVLSAAFWLRDFDIDIACIRLSPHSDESGNMFVNPEVLIPLPEAKNYIQKKVSKQREQKGGGTSSFSMEKSDLTDDALLASLVQSLSRSTNLTPRLRAFFKIILEEDRPFDREEVKQRLLKMGIGSNIGNAGRLLSNISQFLTKKLNPHLRQIIEFDSGGEHGETKNKYRVLPQYRALLRQALKEVENNK